MTVDTFFNTNFLFKLGLSAATGKSTISHMYQKVLPIYLDEIGPDTFNFKNKYNHKYLFKFQTARHLFCDEIDIYNINFNLFKIICEVRMIIKPLYSEHRTFLNESHPLITGNH